MAGIIGRPSAGIHGAGEDIRRNTWRLKKLFLLELEIFGMRDAVRWDDWGGLRALREMADALRDGIKGACLLLGPLPRRRSVER